MKHGCMWNVATVHYDMYFRQQHDAWEIKADTYQNNIAVGHNGIHGQVIKMADRSIEKVDLYKEMMFFF